MAAPPRFSEKTGPTLEYVAEVLDELAMEAGNHGTDGAVGRTCLRAFDVLLWIARDYLVPEHLRRD